MYFKHTGVRVTLAFLLVCLSACSKHGNTVLTPASSSAGPEATSTTAPNASMAPNQHTSACGPIDEGAASDILGVSAVRPANSWHERPNDADDLACVYNSSDVGAVVPSLKYEIISPSATLLGPMYSGMSVNADEQHFEPGVAMASSGAIGSIDTDNFHATILLRTNTIIARINVSGLPSADAAKAAAMKAASKF